MSPKPLRSSFVVMPLAVLLAGEAAGQAPKDRVLRAIEGRSDHYASVAHAIWEFAELGYQEVRSSALLQRELGDAGFTVRAGVAEIPTAFVAEFGSGRPVIGILAEFDALPGLSQAPVPVRQPLTQMSAGHACGHHLFGTASTAAAIAVKQWLVAARQPGTLRVYGTPAEEGGSGKVYMVRAGLFDDADAVLSWHPGDANDASPSTTLANKTGKFRFHGYSAHAAGAPERGRSALDGVEAMTHMVNMLREHVPQEARIHYVITAGGLAPNVVPDFAEVYMYARHPDPDVVEDIWSRMVQASEGAALGTGTRAEHEITGAVYSLLPNEVLARVMFANLQRVGGVEYTSEERAFASKLQQTFEGGPRRPLGSEREIQAFEPTAVSASTDAGDVSWVVPSADMSAATWVPGTAAHTWQAVAAGGMSIGHKGMIVAAKTLAATAVDVYLDPSITRRAREEFERRRGPDFAYTPLLGNRKPALDYRK